VQPCATPTQTRAALVRGHGLTALWQLDGAAEQQHAAWLARQEQWGHGCQLDQAWHSFASALRAVFCIAICSSLFPLPPGCTGIACFAQTHQSPYKPVVSIRSTARLHLLANSAPPLRRKHCGRQGHLSMPLGTLLPGFLVAFLQYVSRPEAEAGNCVKRLAGSVW